MADDGVVKEKFDWVALLMALFLILVAMGVSASIGAHIHRSFTPDAMYSERVSDAFTYAQNYWGENADIGHIRFEMLPTGIGARWEPFSKTIILTIKTWSDDELTVTMIHEYGHALGLRHSPDPTNVMYYTGVQTIADLMPNNPLGPKELKFLGTGLKAAGLVCHPVENSNEH